MSFIIYCLPRSRSAWMAHYLNYPMARPPQPVAHDVAILCKSVAGFVRAYKEEGMWGSIETGGIMAWRLLEKELPDLRRVVVRRPLQEVYKSLTMQGVPPNLTTLAELNAMLDDIAAKPDVYSINAADLDAPGVCKWLFEYCLELEFDFSWWARLQALNIQIDMDTVLQMKDEIDIRYTAFQQDVFERMEEHRNCLH